jgi:hypothetical protein
MNIKIVYIDNSFQLKELSEALINNRNVKPQDILGNISFKIVKKLN